MRKVLVFACVLCVDILIVYTLDLGGALLKSRTSNLDYNLFRQWAESALRCTLLYTGSVLYKDAAHPLVRRWITVHCFIASVYETGRSVLFDNYRLDKFNSWLVGTVAAALACLFWEVTLPDTNGESNGKDRKQRARVLFIRVIRMSKPDYILLCGAFVFLTLAVLCEYFVVFMPKMKSPYNVTCFVKSFLHVFR